MSEEEKTIALGARLETCAGFVREGKIPADVGTDHAYLPIWLVQTGKVPEAYATDINEDPIKTARCNIASRGLSEKIKAFTTDGLEKIPYNEVDDIIIAGMGGDNIAAILSGAEWLKDKRYRLILQPMTRASRLREYLFSNGFDIISEKAVREAGKIYTVICAEYSGESWQRQDHADDYLIYAGCLDSSDANAAALLKKQAGILRSMSDGCAAKGDISGQRHYAELASRITESIEGGKTNGKRQGSI